MTTAQSPLPKLRAQADRIAVELKKAARKGYFTTAMTPVSQEEVKFAVAMDDKIITVVMAWKVIRQVSASELSDCILEQMQK